MDLTTRYLGMTLRNLLIASVSPLTGNLDNIQQLVDLGGGAVVRPSIFEEQIDREQELFDGLMSRGVDSFGILAQTMMATFGGLC
jgi:dihydroorotate dehydrogenase (fumarate)